MNRSWLFFFCLIFFPLSPLRLHSSLSLPPPTLSHSSLPPPHQMLLALFLAISLYPPILTLLALGHLAKATLAVAQTSNSVSGVLVRSCSCCLL